MTGHGYASHGEFIPHLDNLILITDLLWGEPTGRGRFPSQRSSIAFPLYDIIVT